MAPQLGRSARRWSAATVHAALLLAVLLPVTVVHGEGTPLLITDDPGTPGPGRWEVNAVWMRSDAGRERMQQLPLLELNYGLGENRQIKYPTALLIQSDESDAKRTGVDHSTIGFKWRFLSEPERGYDLSVHPQFKFRLSGSSVRHGLVADENALVLPLQWQRTLGPWVVFSELGLYLPSKSTDEWFYGVAVCRNLGRIVTVGAELNGQARRSLDEDQLIVSVGAHIQVESTGALLVTLATDLRKRPGTASARTVLLGWQVQL